MRLDLDVRRIWLCPNCGHERKAMTVTETKARCRCADPPPWMRLIEPTPVARKEPEPLEYDLGIDVGDEPLERPPMPRVET